MNDKRGVYFDIQPSQFHVENKSKQELPLETKHTQNHENRRLGLGLFMRNIVVCEAAYAP